MTADPPFEVGASQVRRTWPDTFVGAAASDRGAVGTGTGTALATLLVGLLPTTLWA